MRLLLSAAALTGPCSGFGWAQLGAKILKKLKLASVYRITKAGPKGLQDVSGLRDLADFDSIWVQGMPGRSKASSAQQQQQQLRQMARANAGGPMFVR